MAARTICRSDKAGIFLIKAARRLVKNRSAAFSFAGGDVLHCKRWPFRTQEATFRDAKHGLLEGKRYHSDLQIVARPLPERGFLADETSFRMLSMNAVHSISFTFYHCDGSQLDNRFHKVVLESNHLFDVLICTRSLFKGAGTEPVDYSLPVHLPCLFCQ